MSGTAAVKVFSAPEPCARARSARPLPVTTFWEMRLPPAGATVVRLERPE